MSSAADDSTDSLAPLDSDSEICAAANEVPGENESQNGAAVSVERLETFSGPLPHPAIFAYYDRVQPGFAERIMRMTEKQLDHQMALERDELDLHRSVADAEVRGFARAQWFTFTLVLVFLAVAGVGLFRGQELGAGVAGIAALATVAYALHGRRRAERELDSPGTPNETPNDA